MPGFTFPSVGRLGTTSPPSQSDIPDHRYYVPLRLPKVRHGIVRCSLSAPVTLVPISICVFVIAFYNVNQLVQEV